MKKHTQRQLADLYHCDQATVSRLKKEGVDIHDANAVRAVILAQPNRPADWVSGCPWDEKPEKAPVIDDSIKPEDQIDNLEKMAMGATDYNESRFVRTKIQSLKDLLQLRILAGDYIHRDEVTADFIRIGNGQRAALKQMQADLPAMTEGLSAAEIKKKIAEYNNRLASMMANEFSNLYK